MFRCPGQDQRYWKPEDIFEVECPRCGRPMEFFKDEPKLKCKQCAQVVMNPKIDLGCAEWCQYAAQCIGTAPVKDIKSICQRLIEQMKEVFGDDRRRIDHALAVLDYAEKIQAVEGGDPLVVKAAAILHDIGIHEAERKYGSTAGKYQEIEGPPIARRILSDYELEAPTTEHICRIIANHHSAREIDTVEFRCVWDADQLVNIPEEHAGATSEELRRIVQTIFKTEHGRTLAHRTFLAGDPQ